jgi:hypothetical protein
MSLIFKKKLYMLFIYSTILNFITLNCESSSPGFKLAFSQSGIKSLEGELIPAILKSNSSFLPPIIIKQHVDFLGTIQLNITDIELKLDPFNETNIEIIFVEKQTIMTNLNKLSGKIIFNWLFKSGFYDNISPGYVQISNMTLKLNSTLFAQQNLLDTGKLSPGLNFTNVEIGNLNIDINFNKMGRMEQLIRYLIDNLQQNFIQLIKEKFTTNIPEINLNLNKALASIPLHYDIPKTNFTLDLTLADQPLIHNEILEINLNSTLVCKQHNETYEGPSYPIPHPSNTSALMDVYVNEFVFDSLLFLVFKENLTTFYIKADNYSSFLNTFTLGLIIPQLSMHYNSTKNVDLNLNAKNPPDIKFGENLTEVYLDFLTDFIVRVNETANDTIKEVAFTADMGLKLNMSVDMQKGQAHVNMNEIIITNFTIVNSNIGPIQDKDLPDKLNGFIGGILGVLQTAIDGIVSKFKLPSFMGISLNQTDFSTHDGYLKFGITPIFSNSTQRKQNSIIEEAMNELKFLEENKKAY